MIVDGFILSLKDNLQTERTNYFIHSENYINGIIQFFERGKYVQIINYSKAYLSNLLGKSHIKSILTLHFKERKPVGFYGNAQNGFLPYFSSSKDKIDNHFVRASARKGIELLSRCRLYFTNRRSIKISFR